MNDSNTKQLSNECIPCSNGSCGTGIHNGAVKPGDPLRGSTHLTAQGAVGGINLWWDFPPALAYAIQHTVVYRAKSPEFSAAVEHAIVSGNRYFDYDFLVNDTTRTWYWVKNVTVNGTEFDLVGSASAQPLSFTETSLEELAGKIDDSYLAHKLREQIDRIEYNHEAIEREAIDRSVTNAALQEALASVQRSTDSAITLIDQKVTNQSNGLNGLVQQINTLAAGHSGLASAIIEERTVSVTERETLARRIDTLYSTSDDLIAAIRQEEQTRISDMGALALRINTTETIASNAFAAVKTEEQARINADSATATQISTLYTELNKTVAAVQVERQARIDGDSAVASQITTVQSSTNTSIASVRQSLTTDINSVNSNLSNRLTGFNSTLTSINNTVRAMYTVQLNAGGMVGGFGLVATGSSIQAGFDVDTFWIGRSTSDRAKPFYIEGGVVYINNARIKNADITTLKIAGNAVTVPVFNRATGSLTGNGSFRVAVTSSIYMATAGYVFACCSGYVGYPAGWTNVTVQVLFNGAVVQEIGASQSLTTVSMTASMYAGAGSTVNIQFRFISDSKATLHYANIFAMGCKR